MSQKNPIIELPVKITLSPEGIEWFLRHKRPLQRLRMADGSLARGIPLAHFTAASLQKMINVDYIEAVELARTEFTRKRRQIIDLTKLIAYRILYKKFEEESFQAFLDSPLVQRWNRRYPTRIIDADSSFNHAYVENLLMSVAPNLPLVSQEIQEPLLRDIRNHPTLSEAEKQILHFQSDRYMISIRNILWCVLVQSRGQREYRTMIRRLQQLLGVYLAKGRTAEYLALLVNELLTFTESDHYLEIGRHLHPGRRLRLQDLRDPALRSLIRRHMQATRDLLYLNYQVGGSGPTARSQDRLRISIFNRTDEHGRIKERVEGKLALTGPGGSGSTPHRARSNFYREALTWELGPELGLYYLPYLQEECGKTGIGLHSRVSQIPARKLTVIRLTLQF